MNTRATFKTEGIVLKALNYGDSDLIVTFHTRHFGKLTAIAKGARKSRKRFVNVLEPFCCSSLLFYRKQRDQLAWLESCSRIHEYPEIRKSLDRTLLASYLIDLVDHFSAEEKADPDLFELLQTFLSLIEEGDTSERLLRFFEIRHLKLSGYAPALDRCILCNSPLDSRQRYVFSIAQGGLHCRSCSSKSAASDALPISLGTIKTLQLGREIETGKMKRILFSGQTARESKALLSLFIGHILGKELKSLKVLDEIQSMGV
ncbi:DNA replication and repair protein RecO [Syntrophus gentianae]|uniref:DNA repair protein RecO n=1 Tax=Syntrophus gentianae TaxID=43775 RepID=A0A1H7WDA8_9BACT|nr:DNA repair protein RecO [Syntrophus gentianae]SEM19055.1 DNA replication and repair protein RecO [Syntrophus gentianae]